MILGLGVDAVEVDRVHAAVIRTPGLLTRLWSDGERSDCAVRPRVAGDRSTYRWDGLAARFAAKEAVAKALGTGVRGFAFRDVEVVRDELGRPAAVLHGEAAETAARLGIASIHLTLSATRRLAVAAAVAESA